MGKRKFSTRRLFLVLLVIACIALAIWTGYQLFFLHKLAPLIGSIIFIADIGVLIFDICILRNKYYSARSPNFFIVFISVLAIFLILSFAGVQPLYSYKNNALTSIADVFRNTPESKPIETPSTTPSQTLIQPPINIPAAPSSPAPNPQPQPATSPKVTPPPTPPPQPSLVLTDIVMNVKPQDIFSGMVNSCKVSIYLEPSSSTEPGYYKIELLSNWTSYGTIEFKYLRGDTINPMSWTVSGGETWLAMGRGDNLRSIFKINISYSPFEPSIPIIKGTIPSPIENAIFGLINSTRARVGAASLDWSQIIQDETRIKALTILQEGKLFYPPLESQYSAQLIYSSKTYSGETADMIARKAFASWYGNEKQKQILLETEFTSMAVGYVVEARESIYYIDVLFTAK